MTTSILSATAAASSKATSATSAPSTASAANAADTSDTPFTQLLASEIASQDPASTDTPLPEPVNSKKTDEGTPLPTADQQAAAAQLMASMISSPIVTVNVPKTSTTTQETIAPTTTKKNEQSVVTTLAVPTNTEPTPTTFAAVVSQAIAAATVSDKALPKTDTPPAPVTTPAPTQVTAPPTQPNIAPVAQKPEPPKAPEVADTVKTEPASAPVLPKEMTVTPTATSVPTPTIATANESLNAAQMTAIAPILTVPAAQIYANKADQTIAPRVGTANWDAAIGQKITWMVAGGLQSASLTLNPPDLGPLQVVLNVNNQHANATFISHQPEVRAALENAIPKLREMMGSSGIQLGQCNVNSQAQQQQQFTQTQTRQSHQSGAMNSVREVTSATLSSHNASNTGGRSGAGLVDTFV